MVDNMLECLAAPIIFIYQLFAYVRLINPMMREAILLVIHNFSMYYIINCFKHLLQTSINSSGPVNTFYYVPLVYEAPAVRSTYEDVHVVLRSTSWHFLETLFRHHLALLLPFIMALSVPRCKLVYVSSLVILSNFTMCMCFIYSMWKWLALSGFSATFQLLPIVLMGPVLQLLLMVRFTGLMMLNLWTVV
ncbi:uncharacterized protein LOC6562410 isoform X1 [Drosophila grimshawi]|uniref:uncharacterized protein LOC6562410 isoform X1 n=1 Tax=Drosophila grimshawi TaxID=7222 RepID=UPI001C935F80|nr:uncharacterized protein LOC6562410 isoform X1 [Drosophila grimshawi]